METKIDPSVIAKIQKMDASNDEKIGRLDAYVHEILYNRRLYDARYCLVSLLERV